jgi:parvulin-like peptidyl-prolyl isomerase
MKALRLITVTVAFASLFAGCSKKPAPDPKVLAQVGSRQIRVEDVQKEIDWRQKNRRPAADPTSVLDDLIEEETLLQEAHKAGIQNDPDVRRAYRNVLITRFKEGQLTPKLESANATPEEIQARYQEQLSKHTRPGKARLAMIHLQVDDKMSEETRTSAQTRIQEARKRALAQAARLPAAAGPGLSKEIHGFGTVAAEFSEDQASRYKGGDIGWFDEGASNYRWPTEVIAQGFALTNQGDVSEVISAQGGLYLVMKLDTRPATVTPLAQVTPSLSRRIATEKKQQVEQFFFAEMRRRTGVKRFPEALAQLPVSHPTLARRAEPEPPGLP